MQRGQGDSRAGLAGEAESDFIGRFSGRIAGLETFPGMDFLGLAWASSVDPGASPIVRYVDALYRRSVARSGYAHVAVRTWFSAPLAPEEFSDDPHLGTHLRDFMLERFGGELDLEFGIAEIAQAFDRADRPDGRLSTGELVAARYSFPDVVTLVGYADHVPAAPRLTRNLGVIPRIRS